MTYLIHDFVQYSILVISAEQASAMNKSLKLLSKTLEEEINHINLQKVVTCLTMSAVANMIL